MAKSTRKVRQRIDRRNWSEYNRWQSEEVRLACLFLKALAESCTIRDWERRRGRPRIPRRELVLCLLVRSYFHLSFRRTVGLLKLLEPAHAQARDNVEILLTLGDAHFQVRNYKRAAELFEARMREFWIFQG